MKAILFKKTKNNSRRIKDIFIKWLKSKNLFDAYMEKFDTPESYRFRVEMYYDIIHRDNLASFDKYLNSVKPMQWISGAFQWMSTDVHQWSAISWEWRGYLLTKYPNMRDSIYI